MVKHIYKRSPVQQCLLCVFIQDSNQKTIMEMFQKSFTADDYDVDEAVLLEAANEWDDNPPENSSHQYHGTLRQSPSKSSIKDYFSR